MQNNPVTVTELNKHIKDKFNSDEFLQNLLIKGEISNFKRHYTGHLYFTLKDDQSLVKCIMFKTYAQALKFEPTDGMNVIIFGTVSVFERDGQYQIYAKDMMQDGFGALYVEYEELKNKLEKQGLFDISKKKKIPTYPQNIGVITSETGSVIKDIINVSTRRNPNVSIKVIPSAVQGEGAYLQVAKAIKKFNELKNVDVIIIARGGGSIEDLWPFNEELVAMEIFKSEIPIISAVGHETDFTIADYVADMRAPTPSAAAEIAVPDITEVKFKIADYRNRLKVLLNRKSENMRLRYEKCLASSIFVNPQLVIQQRYHLVENKIKRLEACFVKKITVNKNRFIELVSILNSISPLKTLERGYSVVETSSGKLVKKSAELKKDDEILIKFVDGNVKSKIL